MHRSSRSASLALAVATVTISGLDDALGRSDVPYSKWKHSAECWILTTQDGAALPASASVTDFPVLLRFDREDFDFDAAKPGGEDLRFSSSDGTPLHYEIESWDSKVGAATVWVRVPRIEGDACQALRVHWGNTEAASESDGRAVFNESNGFVSVLHLGGSLQDSVGAVIPRDEGTTVVAGRAGSARHLDGNSGIFCGDRIEGFPVGADASSTEAWFFTDRANQTVLAWGQEQRPGKVMMNLLSPARAAIQCYFADVEGRSPLPLGQWNHVVHTYQRGDSRIYLNGVLDGASTPILDIPKSVRFDIGGWHGHDFVGTIDEIRISRVARSPEWVRLQYENQKPLQTLVGPLVKPGSAFAVSVKSLTVPEGGSQRVTAQAGGARKVYWRILRHGRGTLAAVDRFDFVFEAPRVTRDEECSLRFCAVYADETRTIEIPISIRESVPEPKYTLDAPATWDGRSPLSLEPRITNAAELQARAVASLREEWKLAGVATLKQVLPGKLLLERAQGSGTLTIEYTVDNGGEPSSRTIAIEVEEPAVDAWVERPLADEEYPESGQFFPRDDQGFGSLVCKGKLTADADLVFLRVTADGQTYDGATARPGPDRSFALTMRLKPGLVRYRAEFGSSKDGRESILKTAEDLICGDAYIVTGQSNALATDFPEADPTYQNEWVRTFGSTSGDPEVARTHRWGIARCRDRERNTLEVGYWALDLGRRLVESQRIPICILNGAAGGTRIDQHQRNAAEPTDAKTIYGRLLWRAREAKLTHGIRAILWHQGENDQGAAGPSGRYGYETYRELFVELAAGWRRDYPNVAHYYVFQIWPKACAMGIDGSDNMLREVQRTLRADFSHLSPMTTLGIVPPGGCHFPFEGWAEFARRIQPLIERDLYGIAPAASITPPDLRRAFYADDSRRTLVLEFDQPVVWDAKLATEFYLDGIAGRITAGVTNGNRLTLDLQSPGDARTITYLDSARWSQERLLRGENGLEAFTFCQVPIESGEKR